MATRNNGRTFQSLDLAIPSSFFPDYLHFANSRDGYLTAIDQAGRGRLYRTGDGGRTWSHVAAPYPGPAGGSTDQVSFVTNQDGWLVSLDPAGPVETLYRTTDGGARWRDVTDIRTHLPQLGPVELTTKSAGWLGGGYSSRSALYRSTDGGSRWTRTGIPQAPGRAFPTPTVIGSKLIEPVSSCRSGHLGLHVYTSTNAGQRWTQTAVLPDAGRASCSTTVAAAFPTTTLGWTAAAHNGRLLVHRTTDGGKDWTAHIGPPISGRGPTTIESQSANTAWVTAPNPNNTDLHLWVTSDAGHHWRRVDQLVTQ